MKKFEMMGNTMKIHNRPFGLQIPDYSLAREGNLYGLWDNDTQELAFSCEYEYLRASTLTKTASD